MSTPTLGWTQSSIADPQTTTTTTTNTSKIAPIAPVTYGNKFEVYAGISFMNFQAGQALPKRMNLGGGEALATYWLPGDRWFTHNIGVDAEYRGMAGTTPVFAGAEAPPYNLSRPLVYLNGGLAGLQYRGPRNQYAAINLHARFGVMHGTFDDTRKEGQPNFFPVTGLYTNRTKPVGMVGGSVDYNLAKKVAIRLSPDLVFEHFGTETREFFGISLGAIYRFGQR